MDSLAPAPSPTKPRAPRRMERTAQAVPVERRLAPRLAAPAAITPELSPEPSAPRAFRVATAKPAPGERPKRIPGLAPARATPVAPQPAPVRRMARAASAPRPAPTNTRPRVATLTAPAVAPAAPVASTPAPRRDARALPQSAPRRGPRPEAVLAQAPRAPAIVPVPTPNRVARAAAELPVGSSADRPGLTGVPLGDLSACVSDREEDRLKQAVVAAVTTQQECVSRAGSYRFIDTKNLNAFLMWIDRAASRPVEDRCGELRHALECLENASRRAAR